MSSFSKKREVPLARAGMFNGAKSEELESIHDDGRHMRTRGRELISVIRSVNTSPQTYDVGARVPGGTAPISPLYLGGRLQQLAQQFEQHKVHHMVVRYCPAVPATTTGSLALCFRNDVSQPTIFTGINALTHLATLGDFVQGPVWEEIVLHISPDSAYLRYFDQDSQDYRLEVQGLIETVAASTLVLDTAGAAGPSTLGELYLEYDIEFFGESLDFDVPIREFTLLQIDAPTAVGTVTAGNRVACRPTSAAAGNPGYTVSSFPSGVSTYDELRSYMFYGTIVHKAGQFGGPYAGQPTFQTAESATAVYFDVGQCFWCGFSETAAGGAGAYMYIASDLNSVSQMGGGVSAAAQDGALLWDAYTFSGAAGANIIQIYGTWVKTGV